MSENRPLFEARYPLSYIGLLTFYIWCAQMLIFFTSLYVPSSWCGEELGIGVLLQMALILCVVGGGFTAAFYYGSKIVITSQGLVQSWLWGAITTELNWDRIAYHSFSSMPGIKYHTLKDRDDSSITMHVDIPTSLENYDIFCRHLENHQINLEYGQVLRLASPHRPITERLQEIYPQQYQGPRAS